MGDSIENLIRKGNVILKRRGQLPLQAPPSLMDEASGEKEMGDEIWGESEIEGSGLGAPDCYKLINQQLYVGLGSIRAGNT